MEASHHKSVVPHVFDLHFDWFLELDWAFPLGDRRYDLLHLHEDQFRVCVSHTFKNSTVFSDDLGHLGINFILGIVNP